MRNSLINAAEQSTYDQAKQVAMQYGFVDGPSTHMMCAVAASANASIYGAPADIIKTRAMNSTTPKSYGSIAMDILRNEGP